MKIGMPILYEFDSLEENFAFAARGGFDFVELNLNFSYCRKELLDGRLMKELKEKYGLGITLHFFDEADFGTYEEVAESYFTLLKRYVTHAAECGLSTLVVHLIEGPVVTISGVKNYVYEKEFDEYIARLEKMLFRVENFCREKGVVLALENSKTVQYMEKTYAVLKKDGFSFTFDIGHDEVCGNLPLKIFEQTDFCGVKEFHIHDVKEKNGSKKDHVALGEGKINIAFYKRAAERIGADCLLELKCSDDLKKSISRFKSL
ncbi:MAG: sugar phosphate isomerase/epimerase family protein [Coriobacteriales bacterium]